MKFPIKDFFSKCDHIREVQETANLVTFIEEILNGKLHFLSSVLAKLKAITCSKLTIETLEQCVKFVQS